MIFSVLCHSSWSILKWLESPQRGVSIPSIADVKRASAVFEKLGPGWSPKEWHLWGLETPAWCNAGHHMFGKPSGWWPCKSGHPFFGHFGWLGTSPSNGQCWQQLKDVGTSEIFELLNHLRESYPNQILEAFRCGFVPRWVSPRLRSVRTETRWCSRWNGRRATFSSSRARCMLSKMIKNDGKLKLSKIIKQISTVKLHN
jgi:hypothetical protein